MQQRATSPRRTLSDARTLGDNRGSMDPVSTPQHPNATQQRGVSRGAAYSHTIYERRMERSRSPTQFATNIGSPAPSRYSTAPAPGMTPDRSVASTVTQGNREVGTPRSYQPYYGGGRTNAAMMTPGSTGRTAPPGVPANVGGDPLPATANTALMAVSSRAGVVVPHPTHPELMPTADLALTSPDRAMVDMLVAEANDRHYVEKLFVAQEEKHERNQWALIEAHRRRMLQMSFAAPLRIGRMEGAQEQRVAELIAEYEIGDEIGEQQRLLDDRIVELRGIIETTNRYRDALEELEAEHKAKHDRRTADIEDERRAKKRQLDELTRQYEFATIHNRRDEALGQNYGHRVMTDNFMRSARRDPDPLTSPTTRPRALEQVVEEESGTAFAMRQTKPLVARAPGALRYNIDTRTPGVTPAIEVFANASGVTAAVGTTERVGVSHTTHASKGDEMSAPAAPLSDPGSRPPNGTATASAPVTASQQRYAESPDPRSGSAAATDSTFDVDAFVSSAVRRADGLERLANHPPQSY